MVVSKKISDSLVTILCENKTIDPNFADAHQYCIEQLFDVLIYHISLLIIGMVIGRFSLSCLYIISLTPVKMFAGGAHAKSRGLCSMISYTVFLATVFLCPYLPLTKSLILILTLVTISVLLILTPVCHPNKIFNEAQRRKLKRNQLIYLSGLTIIGLIFCAADLIIPLKLMFLCLLIAAVNQIIGRILYHSVNSFKTAECICPVNSEYGGIENMDLSIAICDDHQPDIKRLSNLLTAYSVRTDIDFSITSFHDAKELLNSLDDHSPFPYHILFLDIEMPGENGIDLARDLNKRIPSDTLLVFVSSFPEYMSDSFSVHPFDFLQKPVSSEQFIRLMQDIREKFSKHRKQLLCVTKNGIDISIRAEEILYIQALNAKLQDLTIITTNDSYLRRGILSDMEQLYPDILFPTDRTTLVNLIHVHYLTDKEVVMIDGTRLPVSVRNRKTLIQLLKSNPTIQL